MTFDERSVVHRVGCRRLFAQGHQHVVSPPIRPRPNQRKLANIGGGREAERSGVLGRQKGWLGAGRGTDLLQTRLLHRNILESYLHCRRLRAHKYPHPPRTRRNNRHFPKITGFPTKPSRAVPKSNSTTQRGSCCTLWVSGL